MKVLYGTRCEIVEPRQSPGLFLLKGGRVSPLSRRNSVFPCSQNVSRISILVGKAVLKFFRCVIIAEITCSIHISCDMVCCYANISPSSRFTVILAYVYIKNTASLQAILRYYPVCLLFLRSVHKQFEIKKMVFATYFTCKISF